jgi:F-type H+-transporting ATPase subunit a
VSIYDPLAHLGIPWFVQASVLAGVLLLAGGYVIRRQLVAADGGLIPDEGLTLRNVGEIIAEMLAGLGKQTIGDEYRRYMPIVGTMFVFILLSNWMGLIPGVGGGTTDPNVTWAWAIISYVVYNVVGIQKWGLWKYSHQLMGPSFFDLKVGGKTWHIRPLAPFYFPLEFLLQLARMLTLAVRLLANMNADHRVVAVFLGMVPIGIPAIFMGLGLLVGFLQAFVFSLLTMIYIGMALDEPH